MRPGPPGASWRLTAVLLGLFGALTSPVAAQGNLPDLGAVLAKNANLSTYYDLMKKYPDILLQLPNVQGLTVVAPSNEAFAKSQSWKADNTTLVTAVLRYHVLQGTIVAANMSEGPPVFRSSLLADKAFTNVTGGQNVVVYRQAGDTVVFASGDGTRSTLLEADALFKGGSVQMVDTLMVPPARLERTARDTYPRDLSAFLGALYAAGIVADVADAADVTIFAPRNAAFQQLAGALETLPREQLMEVLRYHVVPGKVLASTALINDTELVSSLGQANGRVKITRAGNNVFVNAAQVVQPDILIANGVVHVIDNVLNPSAPSRPDPSLGTQLPAFVPTGATSTGMRVPTPFTSALPCTVDCPVTSTPAPLSTTTSSRISTRTSSGFAAARCTGLVGMAVAGGVLGAVVLV